MGSWQYFDEYKDAIDYITHKQSSYALLDVGRPHSPYLSQC